MRASPTPKAPRPVKVLQVTTHDVTLQKLLLPLVDRLGREGYQVVTACRPGRYTPELLARGYQIRPVPLDRRIHPGANLKALLALYRLLRREKFDIVHVHTPVAAALGRVAAQLAGVPVILYTAHGFFFHEGMSWKNRTAYTWIEKLLGRLATDVLFTQSEEDAQSALKLGIAPWGQVVWISNGVDLTRFTPRPATPQAKAAWGLPPEAPVVGFMGRLVAEKGLLELLAAVELAQKSLPDLHLLLVGDITDGDRDTRTREVLRQKTREGPLAGRVVFTGFVEEVAPVMAAMDLFVLPSHREGMPRSIIEAMASAKPVVATDIRGCREEVVPGQTGLLVPVNDPPALAGAMLQILTNPQLAQQMGAAGRQRAEAYFDENQALERQAQVYRQLVEQLLPHLAQPRAIQPPEAYQEVPDAPHRS